MEGVTLGDIASWLALFAGMLTSSGIIYKALVKKREKALEEALIRHLKPVNDRLTAIESRQEDLSREMCENSLETARVDLMQAIEHAPKEHQSILALGEHYFLDLKGDVWMSGIFRKWAKDEGVDISYIVNRAQHLKD